MRAHHLSIVVSLVAAATASAQVRPGIEVLVTDSARLIAGHRLGLLSNQTGVDRRGDRDVDVLRAHGFQVTALFGPEHGFQGKEDRPGLPDAVDSATGLPIYSLYGGSAEKTRAALTNIHVLPVDLQHIGARYYCYAPSAASLCWSAKASGKAVGVSDRAGPRGGAVLGRIVV